MSNEDTRYINFLMKRARKYNSAEEFVNSYNGGLILNRKKVNQWIAGGVGNEVMLSNLLGAEGKNIVRDMGIPDIPIKIIEASEETIGYDAYIQWRGGHMLKDVRIFMVISPLDEFGVNDLESMEFCLLHELAHAKQVMLNRLGHKKIQSEISERSADKFAFYIFSKLRNKLILLYQLVKNK